MTPSQLTKKALECALMDLKAADWTRWHTMPDSAVRHRGSQAAEAMRLYAIDHIEGILERHPAGLEHAPRVDDVLNGATDFDQWSYGGCGLVDDWDIAERLLPKSKRERILRHAEEDDPGWLLKLQADSAMAAWHLMRRLWWFHCVRFTMNVCIEDQTRNHFVVVHSFTARHTNPIPSPDGGFHDVVTECGFLRGDIIRCSSWRPEGWTGAKVIGAEGRAGGSEIGFLDWDALCQNCRQFDGKEA